MMISTLNLNVWHMNRVITILLFALLSLSIYAGECCRNPDTGLVLSEKNGTFFLKSTEGASVRLGDAKTARNFMYNANKCFGKEKIKNFIHTGEQKYVVDKDSIGMYIRMAGNGVLKIRPCDTSQFLIWLESYILDKEVPEKSEKIINILRE